VYNTAVYDGSSWTPMAYGTDATVVAFAPFDDFAGNGTDPALFTGGIFTSADNQPASHIAAWASCGSAIRKFCRGDGSGPACPCGNFGKQDGGCNNSTGVGGATLVTVGSARLSNDTLQLVATPVLTHSTCFLYESSAVAAAQPFGDGVLCLIGAIRTLFVSQSISGAIAFPPTGAPSLHVQTSFFGTPIVPGSARYYQVRYRDNVAGYCPPPVGSDFNLSSGIAIVWYP
jgi:hypothetical protein